MLVEGDVVIVRGPSGSGKSSILRALLGLIEVKGGPPVNLANGIEVDRSKWKIGYVPQAHGLLPHMTLRENIEFVLRKDEIRSGIVDEIAGLLGIRSCLGRRPRQVSLGQSQRAALGRALAVKADLLVLDEVTASLDIESVGQVKEILSTEAKRGAILVIASHDPRLELEPTLELHIKLNDDEGRGECEVMAKCAD